MVASRFPARLPRSRAALQSPARPRRTPRSHRQWRRAPALPAPGPAAPAESPSAAQGRTDRRGLGPTRARRAPGRVRVTLRRDGRAFVQARAGLGCCTPEIGRRVGHQRGTWRTLDRAAQGPRQAIPPGASRARSSSITAAARSRPSASTAFPGTSPCWSPARPRHLRRACDDAEVGSIARILTAAVGAAAGRDPRFSTRCCREAPTSCASSEPMTTC
ncbi:hypothetical protein ACRAWD_03680 [Caulobacter segnis]